MVGDAVSGGVDATGVGVSGASVRASVGITDGATVITSVGDGLTGVTGVTVGGSVSIGT